MKPLIELPEGYYLDNFRQLLGTVTERYSDLLDTTDHDFICAFSQLSENAARLLVRLYTRKGPVFRVNRLRYQDVDAIDVALSELTDAALLDPSPTLTVTDLAGLLTLAELRQFPWCPDRRLGKAALLEQFSQREESGTPDYWQLREPLVARRHDVTLRRLQLMYFGNGRQRLTDFVLSDLGLLQYENYPLGLAQRWFQEPADIDQMLYLVNLRERYQETSARKDVSQLRVLAEECLSAEWQPRVWSRACRLISQLGYQLEQAGEWPLALRLFNTNDSPPARERRCRLLYKLERYEDCWAALQPLLDAPLDSTETRFGPRFQPRLARKLNRPPIEKPALDVFELQVSWKANDMKVEQLACAQLDNAVWSENQLPLAIFMLTHWDWLFSDVPGAFHHPFQSGPADLYQPDFLRRRGTDRITLYQTLTAQRARQSLEHNARLKKGLQNPFFNWRRLDPSVLVCCFDAVPWSHWIAIFQHLWFDLRRHRSGFPDLFQFLPDGYRFIEIKGPGDRLQDNQRDWFDVFAEHGIPAEVWHVRYLPGDDADLRRVQL